MPLCLLLAGIGKSFIIFFNVPSEMARVVSISELVKPAPRRCRFMHSIWKIKEYERFASRIMKTVADLTKITERIDSSLKVAEDVYYAKI